MPLKIKTELVPNVKGQRFRKGGRLYRNVRIFLEDDEYLDSIESVQYELHPTFRQRIHVSKERTLNFEIRIWTYGYFKIRAEIITKEKTVRQVEGFVRW